MLICFGKNPSEYLLIKKWIDSPTGAFDHVTINENLDRVADYSLWDMTQVDCGEFDVSQTITSGQALLACLVFYILVSLDVFLF